MSESEKYIIDFDHSIEIKVDGKTVTLYRIVALRDIVHPFLKVKKGELGGYVYNCPHYTTLSQDGECWVDESSFVGPNCHISGNTLVFDSKVNGNVSVSGNSLISSSKISSKDPSVLENASLIECEISGSFELSGSENAVAELDSCTLKSGFLKVEERRIFDCVIKTDLPFERIVIARQSKADNDIEHKSISGHGVIGSDSLKIRNAGKGYQFSSKWITKTKA